jgi:hypothetical protein
MSWTQRATQTDTGDKITVNTKTYTLPITGGYVLKVEKQAVYDGNLIVGVRAGSVNVTGTVPTTVGWVLLDTTTENHSYTIAGDTISQDVICKTYEGTPYDGTPNPIGTTKFYRVDYISEVAGLETALIDVSLSVK